MATDPALSRLATLAAAAVERCRLDLSGLTVVTEAATGAYAVTPVLAAMAGATRVYALGRSSRYGTFEVVCEQTEALALVAGVSGRIEIVPATTPAMLAEADILTNSGHLRPIDRTTVAQMRATAVIPLMYEAWEFRPGDVDLVACAEKGIAVAGTNECHEAIDVFSFLPVMAMKALLDVGIAVYQSHVLVLCDNAFGPYLRRGLSQCGATVVSADALDAVPVSVRVDAVVVALQPRSGLVVDAAGVELIASRWPGAVICQFWGDIDRRACEAVGATTIPSTPPAPGHMGVLPSAVGPDPVVRLQSGGLKVGEVLVRRRTRSVRDDLSFVQFLESAQGMPSSLAAIDGGRKGDRS